MLVGFVETKNFLNFFEKKFYIYYLAGYPYPAKLLAGYPGAGYLAKSVSGTTLVYNQGCKKFPPT